MISGLLIAGVGWAGCLHEADSKGGGGDGGVQVFPDGGTLQNTQPFDALSPTSYVGKVKNLMTGQAATADEIAMVMADPDALGTLVDKWYATPEFQARMLDFFRNAFQQNQVDLDTLMENYAVNFGYNGNYRNQLEQNIQDSFPRTVQELINEGRPFNEAITTTRFMMTPPMLSMLAWVDEHRVGETKNNLDRLNQRKALPNGWSADAYAVSGTIADWVDPNSAQYMKWGFPLNMQQMAVCLPPGSTADATAMPPTYIDNAPFVDPVTNGGQYGDLESFLFGNAQLPSCFQTNGQNINPQFTDADWATWNMVTIQTETDPATGDPLGTVPLYWDIPSMRTTKTLTVHTPRVGFFSTPAFQANWGTNQTNEMRVTANQTLIVSIGQSIDGENTIVNLPASISDQAHAADPACSVCHSQLDPYKQFFQQSWSLEYHDQNDPLQIGVPASFGIDGVSAQGRGIADLGNILANHPRFPLAWAQKLQFWANSVPALENDPELMRIADSFKTSGFKWQQLVHDVFTSPLVTFAKPTLTTTTNGVIVGIARRDQWCAALSARLSIPDVCGLSTINPQGNQQTINARAQLMPTDTYYRGYALASLPTNPDLFYRSTVEAICEIVAQEVIDVTTPTPSKYSSTDPTTAIADFTSNIMGIPVSDARYTQVLDVLTSHYANATTTPNINPSDALKSTFTLACESPMSVLVGM